MRNIRLVRSPTRLNPECEEQNYMDQCSTTSSEKKNKLLEEYRKNRDKKGRDGRTNALSSGIAENNSAMFHAIFRNGNVRTQVFAD